MRFLVSVPPETVAEKDQWADSGEPVIPWFPSSLENVFLSINSFKKSPYAKVTDCPDLDVDDLANALKKQYPGLPIQLHENYVLAIAMAAHAYPIGTKFQIFITQDTAKLKVVGKEEWHSLWEQQPL
jgi:hypothetical protein